MSHDAEKGGAMAITIRAGVHDMDEKVSGNAVVPSLLHGLPGGRRHFCIAVGPRQDLCRTPLSHVQQPQTTAQ